MGPGYQLLASEGSEMARTALTKGGKPSAAACVHYSQWLNRVNGFQVGKNFSRK